MKILRNNSVKKNIITYIIAGMLASNISSVTYNVFGEQYFSEIVGASFGGSQAVGASFGGSQAIGASFGGSQALGVSFGGSQAIGVSFGGSQAIGVSFGGSQAIGVSFGDSRNLFERSAMNISNEYDEDIYYGEERYDIN